MNGVSFQSFSGNLWIIIPLLVPPPGKKFKFENKMSKDQLVMVKMFWKKYFAVKIRLNIFIDN